MALTLLSCSEEEFDCCLINLTLEQPPSHYCKPHIHIAPLYPGRTTILPTISGCLSAPVPVGMLEGCLSTPAPVGMHLRL